MSITLNSVVYNPIENNGKKVVYAATSGTLPTGEAKRTLEFSHQEGANGRPDRHLIRVTALSTDTSLSLQDRTVQLYMIAVNPKSQVLPAFFNGDTNSASKALVTWMQTGTDYEKMDDFLAGYFE